MTKPVMTVTSGQSPEVSQRFVSSGDEALESINTIWPTRFRTRSKTDSCQ